MEPLDLSFLGHLLSFPASPKSFTKSYVQRVIERTNKRIASLEDRVLGIAHGRVMPEPQDVAIGSGKHFSLSIMFLDISGFTSWPSTTFEDQKRILWMLDVFMAEMMNIVRDHGGVFEKNTGDGLMAYFGAETSNDDEKVHAAVECAVLMHYVNDRFMTPWFQNQGLWPITFRVGIDLGEVTIAKIGIYGTHQFVAIGAPANIANRLLDKVPSGICIGNEVFKRLPTNWHRSCRALPPTSGYVYVVTGVPYPIWELTHRLVVDPAA